MNNLEPKQVFHFFREIAKIPHGSGNEKALSDYLVAFAKERNLEVIQDEAMNVVIRKPGKGGRIVTLQGHIDMVNEKNKDSNHDFDKDPLHLRLEGDMLMATGTTLGGDNGIAVAYMMALLDGNFNLPTIECLFTTSEEVGLEGAKALSAEHIKGSMLINLDSEEEGIFLTSCAGGIRSELSFAVDTVPVPDGHSALSLSVKGLNGGHSGMDIDKGRANANVLLGRVINKLYRDCGIFIADFNGGAKDNAIPREAEAVVTVSCEQKAKAIGIIQELNTILKKEYRKQEPDLSLTYAEGKASEVWTEASSDRFIAAVALLPDGIIGMSADIPGLVEVSSNLGVITYADGRVTLTNATRSSSGSKKQAVLDIIRIVSEVICAEMSTHGDYPAWEYEANSALRESLVKSYKEQTGKEAGLAAIHAGLECGLFADKKPGLDMVSMGPNLYDVHTPREAMSVSSVLRVWEFLVYALEKLIKE